ncbi:MAG: Periplasmic dipeptide transport protein precursor [Candidatus Lokiarchaeum sp. GC14_75]|nr:MAG: Periplasmic dipeptide transport protein precursor [Candidatus Lokiarchaeum sp. GC14_75]
MEKKTIYAIGIIAIIGVGGGIGIGVFLLQGGSPGGFTKDTLVYGTMYLPVDLDPQVAWDSASGDLIDQVTEGLFAYDLSDPQLAIIPRLAHATIAPTWSGGDLNFTVTLRDDVTFHDGTAFNASAVQWNWERMAWALNTTGTNNDTVTQIAELYEWPDGTPFVNHTEVVSEFVIKFVLNAPYAPFQALLCFSGSYIQSPASTTKDAYLITATSDLVGTGPWVYDTYEAGVEVLMHAYPSYYGGWSHTSITKLVFSGITDANTRNLALLSKDIQFLDDPHPSFHSQFAADSGTILVGDDPAEEQQSLVTQYMGMNTKAINLTYRKAISYAINYSYITEELLEGTADRLESPIPEGILMGNWSSQEALYNVTKARMLLRTIGYGYNGTDSVDGWYNGTDITPFDLDYDPVWVSAATGGRAALSVSFTYNIGNLFREDMLALLMDNLPKIGITVIGYGMTWGEYIYRLYEVGNLNRDMLELYWIGWGPDYNDPSNFINPLFTNRSVASNGAQYDGWYAAIEAGRDPRVEWNNVQLLMEAGIAETNATKRTTIYARIQQLLVEEDMPWVWGYSSKVFDAYVVDLMGYDTNAMGRVWFYPCYYA